MEWCYKFLKRAGFSIRKPTHVGQALKENTFELFDRFYLMLLNLEKICKYLKI